ncbi:hypothetical protein [Streptomyces sp. NPDC102462]|uniref:restriction endonuclease subunit S n=1 Tax=Streptomyces sp. NPDC102462 TaxID=3366178 RepID=UPI00381B0878
MNWSDVAKYEFRLPQLGEQQRIAGLMWAFEETVLAKTSALEAAQKAELSALIELYDEPAWPMRRVDEAGEVQLGLTLSSKVRSGESMRPYLRVANVGDDELFLDDVLEMNFDESAYVKFQLRNNDILLVEGNGNRMHVGRSAVYHEEVVGCCFQNSLLRFRSGDEVLPDFAHGWFRRCHHRGDFARLATGTNIAHLPASLLSAQRMPVPPRAEQVSVVERLAAARELRQTLEQGLEETRTLMSRTLNTVLNG